MIKRKDRQIYDSAAQNLASAALTKTTAFLVPFRLNEITINFDGAAVTETVTITRDNGLGAGYDAVLKTEALSGASVFVWRPPDDGCVFLLRGTTLDQIKVQCTKANTPASTANVTIDCEEL